jgi:predicted lipoprotein with Yx(FWY)xxD motif
VAAFLLTALSGCGSSTHRGDQLLMIGVPDRVIVTTATVRGLGPILTDADGHTLYMFPIDLRRHVSCTGGCAGTWPPLVIAAGHRPTAAGAADSALLGTLPDPNTGAKVVTYDGYPLYRYDNDTAPDTANGQDLQSDGAPWYTLTPAGRPLTNQISQADTIQ